MTTANTFVGIHSFFAIALAISTGSAPGQLTAKQTALGIILTVFGIAVGILHTMAASVEEAEAAPSIKELRDREWLVTFALPRLLVALWLILFVWIIWR